MTNQHAAEDRTIFLADEEESGHLPCDDLAKLQRDYQSLQLENILLERHLKTVLDVIQANPQLEEMFLEEMHESVKQKRKQRQITMLETL